jgi:hypothetical protein
MLARWSRVELIVWATCPWPKSPQRDFNIPRWQHIRYVRADEIAILDISIVVHESRCAGSQRIDGKHGRGRNAPEFSCWGIGGPALGTLDIRIRALPETACAAAPVGSR